MEYGAKWMRMKDIGGKTRMKEIIRKTKVYKEG
jgi:hypothetical protein